MALFSCGCRRSCVTAALIVSAIIGVLTAFLQITAVITVAPVFLWVALGIAVVYLGVLELATARVGRTELGGCCRALNAVLAGILGTALLAVILLAVGIVATSVVSAILVGLLLFFLSLTLTAMACFIRCITDCED